MVIANMRDLCSQVRKELEHLGEEKFTEKQVISIIEFVKPKRQKNEIVMMNLIEFDFLKPTNNHEFPFELGGRR